MMNRFKSRITYIIGGMIVVGSVVVSAESYFHERIGLFMQNPSEVIYSEYEQEVLQESDEHIKMTIQQKVDELEAVKVSYIEQVVTQMIKRVETEEIGLEQAIYSIQQQNEQKLIEATTQEQEKLAKQIEQIQPELMLILSEIDLSQITQVYQDQLGDLEDEVLDKAENEHEKLELLCQEIYEQRENVEQYEVKRYYDRRIEEIETLQSYVQQIINNN